MSQPVSQSSSQLRRLIEQARKTRTVNDIFKFHASGLPLQQGQLTVDPLITQLAELETDLFETPPDPLPVAELVTELEQIAEELLP